MTVHGLKLFAMGCVQGKTVKRVPLLVKKPQEERRRVVRKLKRSGSVEIAIEYGLEN